MPAGNAVPSPVPVSDVSSTCILDMSSGIDLFSFCCPLPLAVTDADFMSSPSGCVLPQTATEGFEWGPLELLWSVHCPLSVRHPPRYSNHAVDGFCVPLVLRFQSPISRALNTPICVPTEALCAVVSHPEPTPVLISGVHCQHLLSKRDKLVCRLLAVQSLKWRLSRHDLSGTWTGCIRRAPPTMA